MSSARQGGRLAVLVIGVAAAAMACTGATATPSASPVQVSHPPISPVPRPASTTDPTAAGRAKQLVRAMLAWISDENHRYQIDSTTTIAGDDRSTTFRNTIQVDGRDSRTTATRTTGTSIAIAEQVVVDGRSYTRAAGASWEVADAAPYAPEEGLRWLLDAKLVHVDRQIWTHGFQNRFVLSEAFPLDTATTERFGFESSPTTVTGLALVVGDDGTPIRLDFSLDIGVPPGSTDRVAGSVQAVQIFSEQRSGGFDIVAPALPT